jgi:hypothetical protein
MRKEIVLFIGALFVGSCSSHFSGSLVEQDVSGAQGTAPTRAGAVPYRNDASVAARKDDALKKIARFCGSDSYTITGEGPSSAGANLSQVEFRCGELPATSTPSQTRPPAANSGGSGNSGLVTNPNVAPAPSDFDRH